MLDFIENKIILFFILFILYTIMDSTRNNKEITTDLSWENENIILDWARSEEEIDLTKEDEATRLVRSLTHPLRLKILQTIEVNNDNNKITASEIFSLFETDTSIINQHLRILVNNEILETVGEDEDKYFAINYALLKKIQLSTDNFLWKNKQTSN